MNKSILIVYNELTGNPGEDERDVLEQVSLVEEACQTLGHQTQRMAIGLDLATAKRTIQSLNPDLIFNLAESIGNEGIFTFIPPALFTSLQIPYTGSPLSPLLISSGKLLSKRELNRLDLPTPATYLLQQASELDPQCQYILKPIWEEGSLMLDEEHVFWGGDSAMLKQINALPTALYFIEPYLPGREFNLSLLASSNGPEVLPVAEMLFLDYPPAKPRILGYTAKWHESSFEYTHTVRTFDMKHRDRLLWEELTEMATLCWNGMGLQGYARIDFRVTPDGAPWIIDINANPCLSESGGFVAALKEAGISFPDAIHRILEDPAR